MQVNTRRNFIGNFSSSSRERSNMVTISQSTATIGISCLVFMDVFSDGQRGETHFRKCLAPHLTSKNGLGGQYPPCKRLNINPPAMLASVVHRVFENSRLLLTFDIMLPHFLKQRQQSGVNKGTTEMFWGSSKYIYFLNSDE